MKKKCNHIVGIKHSKFEEDEIIYHDEYVKNGRQFKGEIFYRCPLCKKEIWIWVSKHDHLGKYKIRKYIGDKV